MKSNPSAEDIMDAFMLWAKEYGADLDPADGIIKFILPKEDADNPAGRDMLVTINTIKDTAMMSEVKK